MLLQEQCEFSAAKFGGSYTDYLELHLLLDMSGKNKDNRYDVFLHNLAGVTLATKILGHVIITSDDNRVSTYEAGVQHILNDFKNIIDTTRTANFFHKCVPPSLFFDKDRGMAAVIRKLGGISKDYQFLDNFFRHFVDFDNYNRETSYFILANDHGVFLFEKIQGLTFTRSSDGVELNTQLLAQTYLEGACGKVLSIDEIVSWLPSGLWMN